MPDPAALYPALATVSPALRTLGAAARPIEVPAGAVVFSERQACQGFPLVLEGEIRVSKGSAEGRSWSCTASGRAICASSPAPACFAARP